MAICLLFSFGMPGELCAAQSGICAHADPAWLCAAGQGKPSRRAGLESKADKKALTVRLALTLRLALTVRLAFGELEALTRALLTVLLSLMCARIARKKTELLELTAQFGIELE